ncbi:MAG: hypothetical protein RLZZ293_1551 [Pseudomonadota bacterium]|jgi:colicin import membrane protein
MANQVDNKKTNLLSIVLHCAVIVALFIFNKPISILEPSRSDGIEVSLVSMPPVVVNHSQAKAIKAEPNPIKTLEQEADINLKDKKKQLTPPPKPEQETKAVDKPKPPAPVKPVEPQPALPEPKAKPVEKTKPVLKKSQVNDLLGDALSDNTTSIRKGKALGGNPNGTSDSNNLVGNYADSVINAVRPFVLIPDDLNAKAKAVVKVILNPNLSVRSVTLTKSSGNPQYDQNIQDAIWKLRVFPPLPDGANFVDYRVLNLTFRP